MGQDPRSEERVPAGTGRPLSSIRSARSEPRPDLQESLYVLWQGKWWILAITLLTLGVALLVSSRRTPIYESQAKVIVTPIDFGTGLTPETPNLDTEAALVSSVAVAEIVAEDLTISGPPRTLLDNLSVDRPAATEILAITYRDVDRAQAQRIAEGFAQGYLQYRKEAATQKILESAKAIETELRALEQRLATTQTELLRLPQGDPRTANLQVEAGLLQNLIIQNQLARLNLPQEVTVGSVIQPAPLPSSPVSPNPVVSAAFGLAAGLALGVGLAFLRDRLSGRLRSPEEAEDYLGASVLGAIPQVPEWRRRKSTFLVTLVHWRSPPAEAYRILRTNVLSAASVGAKSIVVTSAHSGEGKSTTVANLGVVLARAGKQVTLVSADLRRPRLHEFFSNEGRVGLTDVLAGRVPLPEALQTITLPTTVLDLSSVSLRLLASGRIPEDPAELLTSKTMAQVLGALEEASDIVLIDVPPVLPVTDALVVSSVANNVLLVIGPRGGTRASVLSARQQLDKVGAQILGGVLNGLGTSVVQTYSY